MLAWQSAECLRGSGTVGLLKRFGDPPNSNGDGRQPPTGRLSPNQQADPGRMSQDLAPTHYGPPEVPGQANRGLGMGPGATKESNFYDLKAKVQSALIAELDPKLD